jgi:hypothetical protein
MTDNNRIEISLSKTKLAKLLFFCVLFLVVGLWLVTADLEGGNPFFNNPITKAIAGYGGILLGLLGMFFITQKLFAKGPGLVLTDQGIYDNSSAFKFGLIPWSDITDIHEYIQEAGFSKQYFVTIRLTDPHKFIAQETSAWKRKLLKMNAENYGSPVHISTNGLKIKHAELLRLVREYFERYKALGR